MRLLSDTLSLRRAFCLSALLAATGPAVAGPADAQADAQNKNPDRIMCERYEEIGSRLGSRKVCRTAREWEAQRRAKRAFAAMPSPTPTERAAGVLRTTSSHSVEDTVARIQTAVESKGIRYFVALDQQQLGRTAKLPIRKSTLVLFGNPPLGVQFIQANPYAALDWPVRMLVLETADGSTEIAWTDFAYIGQRYGITDKLAQLKMASEVAALIASEAGQ